MSVSCVVCNRVKELDARGYPRDVGSTVRARCGHFFCSECLLVKNFDGGLQAYHCEYPGCGKKVAPFTIRRNKGDGTEPVTVRCAWGREDVGSQAAPAGEATRGAPRGTVRLRTGATTECTLLSLLPAVLGIIWPAERGVVGMRVCKQLRRDLLVNCSRILLVHRVGAILSADCVSKDLRRLPEHLMVTLKGNWVTSFGCLKALGKCKGLVHLELSTNVICDEGAGMLAGVLGECKGLAHLDLSVNVIGAEGAGRLASVLEECKSLAYLNLGYNDIGDEGAERLAGRLGGCKALAHLDLGWNMFGAEGAERLAGALGECKALTHLDLRGNEMGAEGAGVLSRALGECKALAHLDLSNTGIGDGGAAILAGVLRECKTLAHLCWRSVGLGPQGARRLAGVLEGCVALTHVDIRGNDIGDEGEESLASVMGQCTVLR